MTNTYAFFDKQKPLTDQVFEIMPAVRVKQVHGNRVVKIDTPFDEWIEADALVTRTPNLPIGVITADCTPVLLLADGVIAAAHAGWRGAFGGILNNTVETMNISPELIEAYIGPCIAQKSYEVSLGFEEPILSRDEEAERFFMEGQEGKLQFDLAGYCAFRLHQCGLRKIHIDGRDTLTDPNFHSHRGGAGGGERNLSAIMIKG